MIPQRCISHAGEEGDCYRACLASILHVDAGAVPNFANGADWNEMERDVRQWLNGRGLALFRTYCSAQWDVARLLEVFSGGNADVPIIVAGQSGRPGTEHENHAVVVMGGAIVHDPSGAGVIAPTVNAEGEADWYYLDVVTFAERVPPAIFESA